MFPLYLDMADVPGKRVLMKVDSGPGRMNTEMLAELRLKGMYLMPGVPNTTQVTQETDQSYGQYKSIYRRNLRLLSQRRQPWKKPVVLTDLAILVFGGVDRVTGSKVENTFKKAFSKEKNLSCWRICGAVPLTRSPLSNPNVRQEVEHIDGQNNKSQEQLKQIEQWNHYYCDFLTARGYAGSHLISYAPIRKTTPAITIPNTKERVQAIRDTKSSGMMFYATGGQHLNPDDFFMARVMAKREGEASAKMKQKAIRLETIALDQETKSLLREKAFDLTAETEKKFVLPEIKLLCKWKGLKLAASKKQDFVSAHIAAARPPLPEQWTIEDEQALLNIQSQNVDLKATALGVAAKQMAVAVTANIGKLDAKSCHLLLQSLAKFDSNVDDESQNGTSGVL